MSGTAAALHAGAGRWLPLCWGAAGVLGAAGLCAGLAVAPPHAVHGDSYRLVFVHAPAAWTALAAYGATALFAGLGLLRGWRAGFMLARAAAPTGALMAFLALWTGSMWGRPSWGSWWMWDARQTSVLILLFLFAGFLALHSAIDDRRRADRAGALLALVGAANVPVIYVAVQWWQAVHQGAPGDGMHIQLTGSASAALGLMQGAFGAWALAALLHRLRSIVLECEGQAAWARVEAAPPGATTEAPAAPAARSLVQP